MNESEADDGAIHEFNQLNAREINKLVPLRGESDPGAGQVPSDDIK